MLIFVVWIAGKCKVHYMWIRPAPAVHRVWCIFQYLIELTLAVVVK